LNIIPKLRKIKIHSAESSFNKKRLLRKWFFITGFFMACLMSLSLSACRNPKGEDGVSTLKIDILSDIKDTGYEYQACVGGLTKGSEFGCVSKSGNTAYPLQEDQPYLHNAGTYDLKLSVNGSDNHTSSYTIEVDEGKAGSDPRKGIDGKNRAYVLEFKLNQAVLWVTEE
jgi:hypothetical protein